MTTYPSKILTAIAAAIFLAFTPASAVTITFDTIPEIGENYLASFSNRDAAENTIFIADSQSNPINPFAEYTSSLYIRNSNSTNAASLRWEPFTSPATTGSVEVVFNLANDGFNLNLGNGTSTSVIIRFLASNGVNVDGFGTVSGSTTTANTTHTVRIEWIVSEEQSGFYFNLNDQYAMDGDAPRLFAFRSGSTAQPIDFVTIATRTGGEGSPTPRQSEYFIGSVTIIPEPSSVVLTAGGIAMLLCLAVRMKRKAA